MIYVSAKHLDLTLQYTNCTHLYLEYVLRTVLKALQDLALVHTIGKPTSWFPLKASEKFRSI